MVVYFWILIWVKEYGELYGVIVFYDLLEDFFDEGDFDVVYIVLLNSKYYEQVCLVIENDKFVILEKLVFVNLEEFSWIELLLVVYFKVCLVEVVCYIYIGFFYVGED